MGGEVCDDIGGAGVAVRDRGGRGDGQADPDDLAFRVTWYARRNTIGRHADPGAGTPQVVRAAGGPKSFW
jgi:hypothetical protein